ncbi:hypothetical protein [Pseudomonas sp. Q2-TVG4-2]|nr:hypothetical protein [Pseudomonas sp. Q2-TVG4-2]
MNTDTLKIKLIGKAGAVLGWLSLPGIARLADLEQLRNFGACRLELV